MAEKTIDEMSDAERWDGFMAAWKEYRGSGFEVTQEAANKLAAKWKVEPPKLHVHVRERGGLAVSSDPLRGLRGRGRGGF